VSDPSKPVDARDSRKSDAVTESERKRKRAKMFGDVLPDGTRDEQSGAWGDRESGRDDDWFRSEVPPHHG
jgi:hypothetical protein